MAILSASELGRAAGVSRQAASKWIKEWDIPTLTDDKGKRGVDSNHRDVANYLASASAQRRTAGRVRASTEAPPAPASRSPATPGQPKPAPDPATSSPGQGAGERDGIPAGVVLGGDTLRGRGGRGRGKRTEDGDGPSRSDFVARKEKALAEKHELANRILRHEYVPITDLKSVFGKVISVHTGIIQPLGAKLAAQVAAEFGITDGARVLRAQEIIDGETYPALSTIKQDLEDFLQEQRDRVITAEEELALEADEE